MTTQQQDEQQLDNPLGIDAEHFRLRVLQDALAQATSSYWLRRAEALQEARSRPGDYTGQATPAQLAERDQRLAEAVTACRRHATLVPLRTPDSEALVADALQGVD